MGSRLHSSSIYPDTMTSPASSTKSNKATDVVDLDEIVKRWAVQMFDITKTKDQARIPKDNLVFIVSWERTRFVHSDPMFRDKRKPPSPKSQVLFKTHFSNNTNAEQEYSFKADRTTTSVCEFSVERAVTTGMEMNLNFKTPCDVFEAHAGIHREVTISKTQGETIEHSLAWGVDSVIKVKPLHKTTAELVILEDEFEGDFQIRTDLSGKIHVSVLNVKDNNSFVKSIDGDIAQIFKRELDNGLKGFTVDNGIISYVTNGRCRFLYGIEQHVQITEQKMSNGGI